MLFLLVTIRVAQMERAIPSLGRAALLGALCGWGCVELPGFFLLALTLFGWLILHRLRWDVPWRQAVSVGMLAGLVCAVLVTLLFATNPTHGLRATTFFPFVAGHLVRLNLKAVSEFFPRLNWLWLLLLAYVPLFASLAVAGRALRARSPGITGLCLISSVTALLCILPSRVSPWILTCGNSLPFSIASLATAVTIGFLAAFWRLTATSMAATPDRAGDALAEYDSVDESDTDCLEAEASLTKPTASTRALWRIQRQHARLATALGLMLAVSALIAAAINLRAANGRNGDYADVMARELLDRLGSREWIVTRGGSFDLHLRVVAHERRRMLHLLPLTASPLGDVRGELEREIAVNPIFSGHTARLVNALRLGVPAFVREWLTWDAAAEQHLVAIGMPEIWTNGGRRPVTDGFAFTGVRNLSELRGRDLTGEHQAIWARLAVLLKDRSPDDLPAERLRLSLSHMAGAAANNLGVLLEDLGRAVEARSAYAAALRISPDNISAQINLIAMSTSTPPPEAQAKLMRDIRLFRGANPTPLFPMIATVFGEIRHPEALAAQGQVWMRLGEPTLGKELLARAIQLNPRGSNGTLHRHLASIARQQNEGEAARQAYMQAWKSNTNSSEGLLGLAIVALENGRWAEARDWIERARETGVPEEQLAIPLAAYYEATGDDDRAIVSLRSHTDDGRGTMEELALLADLLLKRGELVEVERRVLPNMERMAAAAEHVLVHLVRARVLAARTPPSYDAIRNELLRSLQLRPDLSIVWDDVLRYDLASGNRQYCEEDVASTLQSQPDHPLANSVLGAWLLEKDDLDRAEDALRRSLAARPSIAAHNNLAETLRRQHRLPEAEAAARAALALDDANWAVWDTLACVLMDLGRLDEAEAALAQAQKKGGTAEQVAPNLRRMQKLQRDQTKTVTRSRASH
ncbi:MAG: tetratricopeptide repeat protein [Kiritimatiellae bacterium]|nr:tetratricopeptide repeat protein [Kiritimatiellia bacterium]